MLNFKKLHVWMELKYLKALEQLREDTLLFTSEFLEVIGTHLINLQKMKD